MSKPLIVPPLAVLASGRGSNLAALQDAFPGRVALVISNKQGAPALERAREAGIEAVHLPWAGGAGFEAEAGALLEARGIGLVLLAGFMRLLSGSFVGGWRGRILNIHPSLLPDFPGLHAQQQAIDARVPFAGCTVHFVDAGCDTGEAILQKRVPVNAGDTAGTLAQRLLPAEHEAYPQAVRLFARGLVFPRPTAEEVGAEFGAVISASAADVRAARLLREWGLPDEVRAALRHEHTPHTALARATDELRLGWTALEPLPERLARWHGREHLAGRAEQLGLRQEFERALALTADEWERTRH